MSCDCFRRRLRRYLAEWLRDEENGNRGKKYSTSWAPFEVANGSPAPQHRRGEVLPENPLTASAWALAREGRYTEAEIALARSIVEQQHPRVLVDYGRFLLGLGRSDQARLVLEGAVAVARDHGDESVLAVAAGNLGHVLRARGDLAAAEQMYEKALEAADRLLSPAHIARAQALLASLRPPPADGAE